MTGCGIMSSVWGMILQHVTYINTGSGVRRIIFKRQQYMYKSEQRYINENLLTQNARARTHTAFQSMVILKRL